MGALGASKKQDLDKFFKENKTPDKFSKYIKYLRADLIKQSSHKKVGGIDLLSNVMSVFTPAFNYWRDTRVLKDKLGLASIYCEAEYLSMLFNWKTEPEKGENKISLALIIDSSGSMSSNDKNNLRIEAAKMVIEKLGIQDKTAIIDFDDKAKVLFNLTQLKSENDKNQALNVLRSIDSNGGTDIGSALNAAYRILSPAAETKKTVILLTDGRGRYLNEATQFKNILCPVFTIGLSGDVDESLMYKMAKETGGEYRKANTAADLSNIFDYFFSLIKNESVLLADEHFYKPGEEKTLDFWVDKSFKNFNGTTFWPGSDFILTLISPSGKRYDRKSGNIKKHNDKTYEFISIDDSAIEYGRWKAVVKAVDIPSTGEKALLRVAGYTSIKLSFPNRNIYTQIITGSKIRFMLNIDPKILAAINIVASLLFPYFTFKEFPVNNSPGGNHVNADLNLNLLNQTGDYVLKINAEAETKSGEKITRTIQKAFVLEKSIIPAKPVLIKKENVELSSASFLLIDGTGSNNGEIYFVDGNPYCVIIPTGAKYLVSIEPGYHNIQKVKWNKLSLIGFMGVLTNFQLKKLNEYPSLPDMITLYNSDKDKNFYFPSGKRIKF